MRSLADAIIAENLNDVNDALRSGIHPNHIDEYGFTPLIEAAIADSFPIAELILQYGADVNMQDMTGNTALHWAAENNNVKLAELLLKNYANPNAYNFSGQPVLVMPVLRGHTELKKLLVHYGAQLDFSQDYINTKLLGHMFELVGTADIVDPQNNFVEVDFEGFFIEFTLALITDSLAQFKNHYAARKLREYLNFAEIIVDSISRAARLIKFQQYRTDVSKHMHEINALIKQEPLIIPIGYEGHAITFIKLGEILVKCDRREESRLYDNIVFYRIGNRDFFTTNFIKNLMYEKQSGNFINEDMAHLLRLEPMTELKITAQISGNCSWANVEACIPAIFFLLSVQTEFFQDNIPRYKNLALKFFHEWREWNKDRALQFFMKGFAEIDTIRKACRAEILTAVLFQCSKDENFIQSHRVEKILSILETYHFKSLLQNYIQSYYYEDYSEEGKAFINLLKKYGYTDMG